MFSAFQYHNRIDLLSIFQNKHGPTYWLDDVILPSEDSKSTITRLSDITTGAGHSTSVIIRNELDKHTYSGTSAIIHPPPTILQSVISKSLHNGDCTNVDLGEVTTYL